MVGKGGSGFSVMVLVVLRRLAFDVECRIDGVSKDSLALGSSSRVNLPIDGRWMT